MSDEENAVGGIMSSIDSELLIKEIQKRPALYNKQLKHYSDRIVRENMWCEICFLVVPNWNELDAKNKKIKGAEVQKKWKNLKDCFQREMAAQRQTTSGQGPKKRRKYIHFDDLLFLVPYVKGRETSGNVSQYENEGEEHPAPCALGNTRNMTPSNVNELATPVQPRKKKSVTSYETSLLEILKAKQNDEGNEDKHFALMLVPMMGRLNHEQKHFAKIEILNVMRKAANYTHQPAYSQSFQHHHDGAGHVQYTENQYRQSQSTESLQHFYSGFAANVLSPSSTSGSDFYDMSNQ